MKIFKYIMAACSFLFTSVCILCLIFLFSGILPYVVLSGSMEPAIKTGSIVLIQTRDIDIQPGDVILYRSRSGNTTHRVVEYTNGEYVTKGDANTVCDPISVKKNQIKGKVMFTIPNLGYAVLFFKTSKGICLLFLILFLSLLWKKYFFKFFKIPD